MSISFELENEIELAVERFRKITRIGKPLVIIVTKDKLIINPDTKVKNKSYSMAYGIGYNDGRNDLHDTIYNSNYHKSTIINKNYQ